MAEFVFDVGTSYTVHGDLLHMHVIYEMDRIIPFWIFPITLLYHKWVAFYEWMNTSLSLSCYDSNGKGKCFETTTRNNNHNCWQLESDVYHIRLISFSWFFFHFFFTAIWQQLKSYNYSSILSLSPIDVIWMAGLYLLLPYKYASFNNKRRNYGKKWTARFKRMISAHTTQEKISSNEWWEKKKQNINGSRRSEREKIQNGNNNKWMYIGFIPQTIIIISHKINAIDSICI